MPPTGQTDAGVFAVLTPRNRSAVMAFTQLCDFLHRHPSQYTHHRRFIHIQPAQVSLGEALHEPGGTADSTDATDSSHGSNLREEKVWTGRFVFSLDAEPQYPLIGWRCGYGRWSNDPQGRLDIALGLPEDSKRLRIYGNHLRFTFLPETGAFAIRTNNPAWVDTDIVDRNRNNGLCVLTKPQQILEIGDASYEFRYTVTDEKAFVMKREHYVRDSMQQPLPPICEMPTPSGDDVHVGKWRLLGSVGRGTESIVVSAISSGNQLAVIKTLHKIRSSNRNISNEIHRLTDIRQKVAQSEDSRYLLTFLESVQDEQTAYFVFSPHARHDLNFFLEDPRAHNRQMLGQVILQALRGVRALHAANFMHKDLKPANIGVSCMDPPHAVVLDLGYTTEVDPSDSKSRPGTVGTVGYIAPEMEDVNYSRYGTKVDIWAMGCVAMELLLPRKNKNGPTIPWNTVYAFPPTNGNPAKRLRFNPWRTYATFHPPCPMEIELEGQRNIYKKTIDALSNSDDPLEQLVGGMLTEPPHWRLHISTVIEDLEALHIDNWQEQSTAGKVPSLMLRPAEGDSRGGSPSVPRKSMKRSE